MLFRRKKKKHIDLQAEDFIVMPGTIRFGADEALTVITAYLDETPALRETAASQRLSGRYEDPAAYIAVYDLEYSRIILQCIYPPSHIQKEIRLKQRECNALYAALRKTTKEWFEMDPEDILNTVRKSNGLPPLL